MKTARERILNSILEDEEGCWNWQKSLTTNGAGQISVRLSDGRKTMRQAYRVLYELEVGPIPEGLELDHLCRNRKCVNPEHLEPVSRYENWRRGFSLTAINYWKTHCVRGHELVEENLINRSRGGRDCKICHLERERARKERNRVFPRTHCRYGHELTTENTRTYKGRRLCRTCEREKARQYRARKSLLKKVA